MTVTTTYRRFTAKSMIIGSEPTYVITEIEPTTKHPLNWMDGSLTREGAWRHAQSQIHHTIVLTNDGSQGDLGCVFSPEVFERAVYNGYVGYGQSMTDGYYAPIAFESWVKLWRKEVLSEAHRLLDHDYDPSLSHRDQIFDYNDTAKEICFGLQTYAHELIKATSK